MGNSLEIRGIHKQFRDVVALDNVSFEVPEGSIFGLLGPNGAGKTTLFSIIAGFLFADEGNLHVLGTDVHHISELQGRITILPQDAAFQRSVPLMDQLVFLRMLDGQFRKQAQQEVEDTLVQVGLGDYLTRRIGALSHGMQKRLGIAQAFLGTPDVILLDEPTSGLDPQNAKQIRDLVREMQSSRNATTVISSHNLLEIEELCDHVAILDHGRVVRVGPTEEILRESQQVEVTLDRELTEAEVAVLLESESIAEVIQRERARYRIPLSGIGPDHDSGPAIRALLQELINLGVTPRNFSEGRSLEEVFLQLTGNGSEAPAEEDSAPPKGYV